MVDPGLTVDIDTSEINELLKQFPEYQNIVFDESTVAMVSSLDKFQELIQGKTPTGVSGDLKKSFLINKPVMRGQTLEGSVATSLAYGIVIERGRTPGKKAPPVDAIELWVKRVMGITKNSRGAAFVVARSIGEEGFEGVFMVEQAFEDGSPQAIKLFDNAIQRSVLTIEKKIEAIN